MAPPDDVLASRRHALHGEKRYRPAAPADPDLLRMRWGALRAALRRGVEARDQEDQEARDQDAGEDVDYSTDGLQVRGPVEWKFCRTVGRSGRELGKLLCARLVQRVKLFCA